MNVISRSVIRLLGRTVLPAVLALSFAAYGQGPLDLANYGVRIEPDRRLIVVLMTLDMARTTDSSGKSIRVIDTALSKNGEQFRSQIEEEYASLPADLRSKISTFVTLYKRNHSKQTDAEIISTFASMAYVLTPAPELAEPVVTSNLPGNLLDVLDFAPLVREFYRRSGIAAKLDDYVRAYLKASDAELRPSTREMVADLLDYLHTRPELFYRERIVTQTQKGKSKKEMLQKVETRDHERHFNVVPEMFAPAGDVIFINARDDYYVIVPPDKDVEHSEVRRAFLQFVFDPLILKNSKDVVAIQDTVKPLLDERRKADPSISPDIFLAISRSLTAAADARQDEYYKTSIAVDQARRKLELAKTDEERRKITADLETLRRELSDETAARLSDDYERGAVLSFYFADALRGMEDAGFDVASSVREFIASFNAAKEGDRLAQNAEARKRALAARAERKGRASNAVVAESPITTGLLAVDKLITAKDYDAANRQLKQLLAQYPGEARIYYNIGRVASLAAERIESPDEQAAKLLEAKTAYTNVLNTKTNDTALLSHTFVALARIYEFADEREYALKLYDKAIEFGDVAGGAFKEALAGKQNLLRKQ
ncbi:MAG: hypothetical protein IT172_10695 [Acidobacteria bacterium]|nr:hypothetical protein [Acidobacteriota bacterium]